MCYLNQYLDILLRQFNFDIWVYSNQLWMYYIFLIPVIFYTIFFFIKWVILTVPLWLPLSMIFSSLKIFIKKGK